MIAFYLNQAKLRIYLSTLYRVIEEATFYKSVFFSLYQFNVPSTLGRSI